MLVFIRALVISLLIQTGFFFGASLQKTDKFTDLSYGLTFVVISFLTWWVNSSPTFSQTLLLTMVTFWGIRLAIFLFIRVIYTKKDKRFDGVRESFWLFARFWLLQGLSVPIILLPSLLVLSSKLNLTFGWWQVIGTTIFGGGFIIETLADWQKFVFKNNPKNKGQWTDVGLWSLARHPNYFGEMAVWWGIFVYALPYLSGWQYLSIIGPAYITSLLLFVSGIPPLEKSYQKRFGQNKDYQSYRRRTNLLVPFILK